MAFSGYRSVTELFPVQWVSDPWSEVQAEQHADAFQLPGRRRDCRERLGCRKMNGDTVVLPEDPK